MSVSFALPTGAGGGMLRLKHRDREMELGTVAHFALDPDAPTVSFDQMLGDRKPEASAADLTGARHIHAVETFKDARLVHLGDADSGVGDGEGDLLTIGGNGYHNLAARGRVLNGVVQQVL